MEHVLRDFARFGALALGTPLRPYQIEPARAILDSVWNRRGLTFTVMMSRQAGKNELSAHLEAYLLTLFKRRGGSIVKVAPTFRPQIVNSMLRLQQYLDKDDLSRGKWETQLGYIIRLGRARSFFFSAAPDAQIVGATASILLEVDEAQDVEEEKYLKDVRPMGASSNVTTVLYGTAWTGDTLLEHVRQENARLEAQDGQRRNFHYPWHVVGQYNPDYRAYVATEIARMGPEHPLIRTQYLLETVSSGGRFLSEIQLAQLRGEHPREQAPATPSTQNPSPIYVAGIDLAGEDEEAEDQALRALEPRRDSTAVTIAEVIWKSELGVVEPHIRVIEQYWWTGRKHRELTPQLIDLLRTWRCQSITVDATGIGAGVASFLVGALGADRVHPFTFTAGSKSELGYQLLGAINGGRVKLPASAPAGVGGLSPNQTSFSPSSAPGGGGWGEGTALTEFWHQARLARSSLHANQRLSWYVDPREGHDDLLVSLALAVEAAQHSRPRIAVGRIPSPSARGFGGRMASQLDRGWGERASPRSVVPSPSGRGWGEGGSPRSVLPSPSGRGWGEGGSPTSWARHQEGSKNFIGPMLAGAARPLRQRSASGGPA